MGIFRPTLLDLSSDAQLMPLRSRHLVASLAAQRDAPVPVPDGVPSVNMRGMTGNDRVPALNAGGQMRGMTSNDTVPARNPEVPAGIPAALAVGQVARVLNLREETVKRALTSGALPSFRLVEGKGWRLVRSADVADLAQRCGLALHWEAAL